MNKRQFFGFLVLFIAEVLIIISLATTGWYVNTSISSFGNLVINFAAGVKTYTMTITTSSGVLATSGKLSDLPSSSVYQQLRSGPYGQLDSGGTGILVTGAITLFFITLVFIFALFKFRKSRGNSWIYFGTFLLFISAGLVAVGIIYYCQKLSVGYSFQLFLATAGIFVIATVILFSVLFASERSRGKLVLSGLLNLLSILFCITAMATKQWLILTTNLSHGGSQTTYIGLISYTMVTQNISSVSVTGSLSNYPGGSTYVNGGNTVLATGIIGLVIGFMGIIFIYLAFKEKKRMLGLSVVCNLFASFLISLGAFLYSRILNVDYSFIMFAASCFLILVAAFIITIGTMQGTIHTKGRKEIVDPQREVAEAADAAMTEAAEVQIVNPADPFVGDDDFRFRPQSNAKSPFG